MTEHIVCLHWEWAANFHRFAHAPGDPFHELVFAHSMSLYNRHDDLQIESLCHMSAPPPNVWAEEHFAPGYKPDWDGPNFDPIWYGISEEFDKYFHHSNRWRPRYGMALAKLRRESGTFLHNNYVQWNEQVGWMNFSYVLGKEEDWENPPSAEEAVAAYLITQNITLANSFGTASVFNSILRSAYGPMDTATDLNAYEDIFRDQDYPRKAGRIAYAYDIESAAILTAAATHRLDSLRQWLGVKKTGQGGPLVWDSVRLRTIFPW